MRRIEEHIIHCSDSEFGDVIEIRHWHRQRGWRDVGYHFVIRRDGEIELGRLLPEVGAHCKGRNTHSIGTCLIGKTSFMPAQFNTLRRLHSALLAQFPGLTVAGHRDYNSGKTCPNFNVQQILEDFA